MHTTAGSVVTLHYHAYLEEVTGETHDISEYLDFSFYDWCWYNDNSVVEETKFGKMDEHISSRWQYDVLLGNHSQCNCCLKNNCIQDPQFLGPN